MRSTADSPCNWYNSGWSSGGYSLRIQPRVPHGFCEFSVNPVDEYLGTHDPFADIDAALNDEPGPGDKIVITDEGHCYEKTTFGFGAKSGGGMPSMGKPKKVKQRPMWKGRAKHGSPEHVGGMKKGAKKLRNLGVKTKRMRTNQPLAGRGGEKLSNMRADVQGMKGDNELYIVEIDHTTNSAGKWNDVKKTLQAAPHNYKVEIIRMNARGEILQPP